MADKIDPGTIDIEALFERVSDEYVRAVIRLLVNLVEQLTAEIRALKEENQRLRDENNRLKGEQGKPKISTRKPKEQASSDISSEKERRQGKPRGKGSKRGRIPVDRQQRLTMDPATLPADAVRKGVEKVIVQDLKLVRDNVCFVKERWYSPSEHKSFVAPLPPGYQGEFGPGVKQMALTLYFGSHMTESKILEQFRGARLLISAGTLSNMLTKGHEVFHEEYDEVYQAGLRSTPWQNTDHTMMKVNGEAHNCQVVCNPLYTIYATTRKQDRLSIIKVLLNRTHKDIPASFILNEDVHAYMETFAHSGFSRRVARALRTLPQDTELSEQEFEAVLRERIPRLSDYLFEKLRDAAAIAAYRSQSFWPVVLLLVCDDAPQFKLITEALGLCWVHEGRHYKKLCPALSVNRKILDAFLDRFWEYYRELMAYRAQPTLEQAQALSQEFDMLFSTETEYAELNKVIARTLSKKTSLLIALVHPEIPLHNNPAELAIRSRVRKRDASFGTRTPEGTQAWDTFMSLADTARKLGVSFQEYLQDRICQTNAMPSLADLIEERAATQNLGASWNTS